MKPFVSNLVLFLLSAAAGLGQSNSVYNASTYAYTTYVTTGNAATGSSSLGAQPTGFAETPFLPYNLNASITVDRNAANAETITPSALANCFPNSLTCTIFSTFTYKHTAGETIQSGTYGLQEAINLAMASGSGTVLLDASYQGPSGTSLILSAKGNGNVLVQDNRNPSGPVFYQWNGSGYAAVQSGGGSSYANLPGTPNVVYTFVQPTDQGSSATIADATGNGNNASLNLTPAYLPSLWTGTGINFNCFYGCGNTLNYAVMPTEVAGDQTWCITEYLPTSFPNGAQFYSTNMSWSTTGISVASHCL